MKYFQWFGNFTRGMRRSARFWLIALLVLAISAVLGLMVVGLIIVATQYPWGFAVIVWLYIVGFIAWQASE